MPTKEEIELYMRADMKNSVAITAEHFNVEPQDVWDILNEKVLRELASCSNPKADVFICKGCQRNIVSENSASFKISKKAGNINHTCDGYVNKDNGSLFEK